MEAVLHRGAEYPKRAAGIALQRFFEKVGRISKGKGVPNTERKTLNLQPTAGRKCQRLAQERSEYLPFSDGEGRGELNRRCPQRNKEPDHVAGEGGGAANFSRT